MKGAISAEDVVSSLSAGVIVVAQDGKILFANPVAGKILRQSVERLLDYRLDELLPLDLTDDDVRREAELELPDGAHTVVGFTIGPANEAGERTILFQEIKSLLELRRERDRLLQMAALGDALPSILHELRNPLAAVTSSLEVLIEDASDGLKEDLHAILWEVRRMNLTLQGASGFVRPMHSKQQVSVDLAVGEAVRILEPTAARRGVALRAEVPNLPLVPLDWGVVSGVVFNLVKNAIDACDPGATIVVGASIVEDRFTLKVADTGSGMTPEVLERCRELFFTSKETGSGIGLALCQQIATTSGGTLSIESTPGKGTTVAIEVPIAPPKASRPRLSAVRNETLAAPRRAGERIAKCHA
jgi:signal transduction histidine kinase